MLRNIALTLLLLPALIAAAEDAWPTVRGNPARTGLAASPLDSRVRLAWRTALTNAPVATCVEPIVARGRVFVTALSGDVIALDAADGRVLWRENVGAPVFHSPAWVPGHEAAGRLYVADIDGNLTCLDAATGQAQWRYGVGEGGFVVSPAVAGKVIYIGSRNGTFYALQDLGERASLLWARDLGAPIWQTAAVLTPEKYPERNGVFVMAEDMVARCLDPEDGTVLWTSPRVGGSSARDYYPVVAGGWVIFPTRPGDAAEATLEAANEILAKASEVKGVRDAATVELLRERAHHSRRKWMRHELYVVGRFLGEKPRYQTLWAFRAEDGRPGRVPVLWGAGCGGVMTPPAVTRDGRPIVLWRSWYNGWVYGNRYAYASASPQRGLGYLDPGTGKVSALLPRNIGMQPLGTDFTHTDETSILQFAGERLLAVHQSSITSIGLDDGPMRVVYARGDTWAGADNAPWQGNEWRGPARGGLAVVDGRGYMACGGYVICLAMDGHGIENHLPTVNDERVDSPIEAEPLSEEELELLLALPARPVEISPAAEDLAEKLAEHIEHYLDYGPYAPHRVILGNSGVYVDFAQSQAELTALARAWPYLPQPLRQRCREHLLELLAEYPPWQEEVTGSGIGSPTCMFPLYRGRPRELWSRPEDMGGYFEPPLGIGSLYGVWLLADRANAWDVVAKAWPSMKLSLDAPSMRYFRIGLDVPENPLRQRRGHWAMNRVISGLVAYIRIAETFEDTIAARRARKRLAEVAGQLAAYWSELKQFPQVAYFGQNTRARGDVLLLSSNAVPRPRAPQCWSFAQLANLRPEVLRFIAADPTRRENITRLLDAIRTVGPAWYVTGANRYLHLGENHTLVPGETPGIMRAMATFQPKRTDPEQLRAYVDLPACPGDWHYVERLVTAIEEISRSERGGG
jgi:outer membrane protein assembly factor BamB